jgi:hypothetical protein
MLAALGIGAMVAATVVFPASYAADATDSGAVTSRPPRDDRSRDRWGPDMMRGYQGGPGPGMMGYYWGMGPGMMGRFHGMGSDMMGGNCGWALGTLDLSADQVSRIDKICDEVRKQHWDLAGNMMDEHARLRDLANADQRSTTAIVKEYANLQALQRQMLEQTLNGENRIESVLNKDQLAQYRNMRRWAGCGLC